MLLLQSLAVFSAVLSKGTGRWNRRFVSVRWFPEKQHRTQAPGLSSYLSVNAKQGDKPHTNHRQRPPQSSEPASTAAVNHGRARARQLLFVSLPSPVSARVSGSAVTCRGRRRHGGALSRFAEPSQSGDAAAGRGEDGALRAATAPDTPRRAEREQRVPRRGCGPSRAPPPS